MLQGILKDTTSFPNTRLMRPLYQNSYDINNINALSSNILNFYVIYSAFILFVKTRSRIQIISPIFPEKFHKN